MSWVDRTRRARRQGRSSANGNSNAAGSNGNGNGSDGNGSSGNGSNGNGAVESNAAQGCAETISRPVPELELEEFDPSNPLDSNRHRSNGNGSFANGSRRLLDGHAGPPRRPDDRLVDSAPAVPGATTAHHHLTLPFPSPRPFRTSDVHEADVVAVLSAEGRFVFVSASAERLLGYDVRDIVGRNAFGLFDAESIAGVRSLFDDLVARRQLSVSMDLSTTRADGRVLDLELVAANHLGEPIGGVVVTLRDVTKRKEMEARANDLDRRHNALIESLVDGLIMVDAEGRIVRVNESFEVMFRSPRIRTLGRNFEEVIERSIRRGVEIFDESGEMLDAANHPVLVSLRRGRRTAGDVVGYRFGSAPARWVRVSAQPIFGSDGTVTGAVGTFSDITGARHAAYALRQEEEFLRVLLDTLDEGIVACDAQGRMTIFNPAARRLHGLADSVEPIGRVPVSRMLLRPDGSPIDPEENPLLLAMSGERLHNVEIILAPSNGEQRKVSVNGQALVDEHGWKLGAVVAIHDVTEQKLNEERLADLAHHDPLTGLANRTLLAERMREAVESLNGVPGGAADGPGSVLESDSTRTHPEHPGVAVYLLDLDNFKDINDALGHDVGDDLLVAVARRLAALVRPSDTVARLGGDEFVVVCEIESGEEEMLRISQRITGALARPYRIDGRTLVAEASVGGVFVDDPATDPSKLLSLADDAMYGVKWSRRRQRRSMTD